MCHLNKKHSGKALTLNHTLKLLALKYLNQTIIWAAILEFVEMKLGRLTTYRLPDLLFFFHGNRHSQIGLAHYAQRGFLLSIDFRVLPFKQQVLGSSACAHPLRVPIVSFWHILSNTGSTPPPTENPGSATALIHLFWILDVLYGLCTNHG